MKIKGSCIYSHLDTTDTKKQKESRKNIQKPK